MPRSRRKGGVNGRGRKNLGFSNGKGGESSRRPILIPERRSQFRRRKSPLMRFEAAREKKKRENKLARARQTENRVPAAVLIAERERNRKKDLAAL